MMDIEKDSEYTRNKGSLPTGRNGEGLSLRIGELPSLYHPLNAL